MINEYHKQAKMSVFGEKIQDFEVLEHLGKGGFAHVYRARCIRTGLFVAIKMIDKVLMANAGMIGRVRQEVTIHSRLKHPAILELYTFFEDAHYVYLILELAHNGELAKHFKLGTRGLSENAAADIFRQVVSGVLYLHSHNIIHRDLSLNNLLLTKDLNVKIADFGLATQLSGPDEKHVTMCGTPNYISPEVASREVHGLPADVWGLGCMLYTLLVGSPPFHTQHVKTTLNRVINADYQIPPELSYQAQDLLQKLLCKDPVKRITLKEIMTHPFISQTQHNTPSMSRQEMSKDSGFLNTFNSTQHSTKIKTDDKTNSGSYDIHRHGGHIHQMEPRYGSMNVLSGISENHFVSRYDNANSPAPFNNLSNVMKTQQMNICYDKFPEGSGMSNKLNNADSNCYPAKSTACKNELENKENVITNSNIKADTIGVPPLCADRLPSISHRTRNAILKIEQSDVVVEFIKKKGKDREDKIVEICKISKDGMKIAIHHVDKGKFTAQSMEVDDHPPPNEVFSYHNLPQKHWKKYLYASRFVALVKAKTPKITLYSSLAKCQLMENGTDIEMFFYNGEKLTFSASDGLKIIDKSLKTHSNSFGADVKYIKEHFDECSNRMKRVESALSCFPDECFPLIIGKRPHNSSTTSPYQALPFRDTPLLNVASFHRTTASSTQAQSDYYQ